MPKGPVSALYPDYIGSKGSPGLPAGAVGVNSDLDSPALVLSVMKEQGTELADYCRSLS